MSIQINKNQCTGCLKCVDICPGNLIKIKTGKAYMKYPKDCWGCASCIKECRTGAIDFYLGADIGGWGSTMNVLYQGDMLRWRIKKADGSFEYIDVNSKNSNKY